MPCVTYRRLIALGLACIAFVCGFGPITPAAEPEAPEIGRLRAAAERGVAFAQSSLGYAQFNLGNAYHKGNGVPQDATHALSWWRTEADQGYSKAQFNIGVCYASGAGSPRDPTKAYYYFSIAAARGHPTAHEMCDRITNEMTAEEMDQARTMVRE